jgi:hypothetical protein
LLFASPPIVRGLIALSPPHLVRAAGPSGKNSALHLALHFFSSFIHQIHFIIGSGFTAFSIAMGVGKEYRLCSSELLQPYFSANE